VLRGQRRLADRDVPHQRRMDETGDTENGARQVVIERERQPIAGDRLMDRGAALSQRHGRRRVKALTDAEVVEVGTLGEPGLHVGVIHRRRS